MAMVIILGALSLLWWIAVGVWRNIGFGNGCAVTVGWGTVPVWSLWLGGLGVLFGLTVAVIEVAMGRPFRDTFGARLALSAVVGVVAAIAGYNLPRLAINYSKCP